MYKHGVVSERVKDDKELTYQAKWWLKGARQIVQMLLKKLISVMKISISVIKYILEFKQHKINFYAEREK